MSTTESLPTIAHIKDHFIPLSEPFIYRQIVHQTAFHNIVLDRFPQQNQDQFPFPHHFSPAASYGRLFSQVERGLLQFSGRSPYLESIIQRQKVQLLHAHFGQLGALFVPVARRHHLPLITSFYGKDVSVFAQLPGWQKSFQNLWEEGSLFLVLGPQMRTQLIQSGCPSPKIRIVPIIVDLEHFSYQERQPPVGTKPIRLLTVGRLIPKKGIDLILSALAEIKDDIKVNWLLQIAGDGPLRNELEEMAHDLGYSGNVDFLGWVSYESLPALMAEAHLFVLPSRTDPDTGETEGTPTVLLEAQATGLPIISSIHADIPDIVEHNASGFLVPENDVHALAAGLLTVINRPGLWHIMGRKGRRFVEENNSHQAIMATLNAHYESCLRS